MSASPGWDFRNIVVDLPPDLPFLHTTENSTQYHDHRFTVMLKAASEEIKQMPADALVRLSDGAAAYMDRAKAFQAILQEREL